MNKMVSLEQQQQQQNIQDESVMELPEGIPPPIPSNPSDDFYRFRIQGNDILQEIQRLLKGEIKNEYGEYEQKYEAWLNDKGLNTVMGIIYSLGINKNSFLGNLRREEILYKCKMLKKKVSRLFTFNDAYEYYGLKKELREMLITIIVNNVHSGLSRSEGGREAEQLSTASQRHDIYSHTDNGKSGGLFNRLSPFGK